MQRNGAGSEPRETGPGAWRGNRADLGQLCADLFMIDGYEGADVDNVTNEWRVQLQYEVF